MNCPKPPKRKERKRSRKAQVREARALLHKIVCKKGYCERCGRQSTLQVSHVLPQGTYRNWLRFEPMNTLCLCYHCHFHFWHKSPIEAHEWFTEMFPARYVWLHEHKNEVRDYDMETVINELKELAEPK